MNTIKLALLIAFITGQAHINASAAELASEPAVPASTSASNTPTTPPTGVLAARQVPKLVLRWDCGDCKQNDKVLPLIEQTYTSSATAKGYEVAEAETAEVVITAYRQRPPGMRVMFGVFAGKDILATRVTFRGKDYRADDYSANSFHGMNSLCDAVAQVALKNILASIEEK